MTPHILFDLRSVVCAVFLSVFSILKKMPFKTSIKIDDDDWKNQANELVVSKGNRVRHIGFSHRNYQIFQRFLQNNKEVFTSNASAYVIY